MWGYMVKLTKFQFILASGVWRELSDLRALGFFERSYAHTSSPLAETS